jgi:hypothetical protein
MNVARMGSKNKKSRIGEAFLDVIDNIKPRHSRQINVQQCNVWSVFAKQVQSLISIGRLSNEHHIALSGKNSGQALAKNRMTVCCHDPEWSFLHMRSPSGLISDCGCHFVKAAFIPRSSSVPTLHFSRDPFADIRRTIAKLGSSELAARKEFHGFAIEEKNVLEIDGNPPRLPRYQGAKHVHMVCGNPATDPQNNQVLPINQSVDSAIHVITVMSFLFLAQGTHFCERSRGILLRGLILNVGRVFCPQRCPRSCVCRVVSTIHSCRRPLTFHTT